jgi:hypothetical protein
MTSAYYISMITLILCLLEAYRAHKHDLFTLARSPHLFLQREQHWGGSNQQLIPQFEVGLPCVVESLV